MTFFLMCAISGAFHLLWLSIAVSLVVFLDSGSETAMSNKAARSSGRSYASDLFWIGKTELVTL